MGVQATMNVHEKWQAFAITVASGAATFPAAEQVRIVTILPAADLHRYAEVQRAIMYCLEYARDNNLYTSAVAVAVVTNLEDGKNGVREEATIANVVTNDIGILIRGSLRNEGGTNINYEAYRQLIDWMNENDRLVA